MSTAKSFPVVAFAALLAGGTAIGFAAIFMRLSDVNAIASAFWRTTLAAPLLWIWAYSVREEDKAEGRRTGFSTALALAGFFFGGDMVLWHLSLHFTTVSNATFLTNLAPILIALWLWWTVRVRFTRVFVAGMSIALIGAALLVGAKAGNASVPAHKFLGDMLGLTSALFYAGYQLSIKEARNRYSTPRLMAWSSTVSALTLLPCALLMPGPIFPAHLIGWLPLLGLALIAQIGGQTVIAYALAHLPASLSSVSLLVQPLTAAVAAWILFGESMGPLQMAGGVLLLWGIYLSKKGS
jgi:drug/metabolite transporter (DMT)-like permease